MYQLSKAFSGPFYRTILESWLVTFTKKSVYIMELKWHIMIQQALEVGYNITTKIPVWGPTINPIFSLKSL